MHNSKFLLEGSLTDRALVLRLVTSFAWFSRTTPRPPVAGDFPVLVLLPIQNQAVLVRPQ